MKAWRAKIVTKETVKDGGTEQEGYFAVVVARDEIVAIKRVYEELNDGDMLWELVRLDAEVWT